MTVEPTLANHFECFFCFEYFEYCDILKGWHYQQKS